MQGAEAGACKYFMQRERCRSVPSLDDCVGCVLLTSVTTDVNDTRSVSVSFEHFILLLLVAVTRSSVAVIALHLPVT